MSNHEKSPSKSRKKAAKPAEFFISYSNHDLPTADIFRRWLEQAGFTTYMQSRDFPTASNFLDRMNDGLKCERLLAVYTANYANSPECMEELWAMRKRDPSGDAGRVVIVKLDATEPPPLLGARVYVNLVGKAGEAVHAEFAKGIAALPKVPPTRRRKTAAPVEPAPLAAPIVPPSPVVPGGVNINQHGQGNIAVGGNYEPHFHEHAPPRRGARAKPPADVVTEEQAVRIKGLMDELIELDGKTFGAGLSVAEIRGKWWGALYKHVPATSFKNYSQRKFKKAVKWAQGHKARMLAELRSEQSDEWRKNAYARIKAHMKAHRLDKDAFYAELSRRAHIDPPFKSLTKLEDDELARVYGAVARDSRKS